MNSHGRFVQSCHRADLAWCAVTILREHEHRPLPAVEPIDGGRHAGAPLARQQLLLRIARRSRCGQPRFVGMRELAADEPPLAPTARLAAIQAAVDENPREPDLEWPRLAVRRDVAEDLDER